ncbi:MAG TPA: hypothetical protein VLC71_04075 [Thermomonas sp.]|nr:hypothetical protein [Thermomonas sp.]
MQYILGTDASPDLAAIEQALATLDPSALVDLDARGHAIRISTLATEQELLGSLRDAGVVDASRHLARLPSECCGGCGG